METATAVGAGRRRIIKRPRLTRMIDESGARIVLLVAPAGYGKTTLAQEWLGEDVRRAAWYRGGPASADVAALAVGLAQATSEIVPGAGDRMRERLRATDRPEEEARLLGEMLAEDLAEWPKDAWLAIDDYHFAMDSAAAEQFVDTLAAESLLRLLVTSRRRPKWASARRRLYGEVVEIDRTLLAMTYEEALEVLSAQGEDTTALLAQARGWPAVIGLAALSRNLVTPRLRLPEALHEYFAEELFAAADPALQRALSQLSVVSSFSSELAVTVLGEEQGHDVLVKGLESGFLSATSEGTFVFQPLLQKFLLSKLADFGVATERQASKRIGAYLLDRHEWDAAFSLARQQRSPELFLEVIEAALDSLLAEGRVATVEQWLSYAADENMSSPLLDFAEAEVAFREGGYRKAETLATQAAHRFGSNHGLTSLAHARAGQSAHLDGRMESAQEHFASARLTARSDRDLRNAFWGRFLHSLEQDSDEATSLLDEFAAISVSDPDEQLRVRTAEILLAFRGLAPMDPDLLSSVHLLRSSSDPLIKSSFLNVCAGLASYLGHYDQSLGLGHQLMELISRYRLNFVLPFAHLRIGVALRGVRKFSEALEHIRRAQVTSTDVTDPYLTVGVGIARAQIELSRGRFEAALEAVSDSAPSRLSASWAGEYVACKALVLAVRGDEAEASELAKRAISMTPAGETRCLAYLARAISALKRDLPGSAQAVSSAYTEITRYLSADTLVTAYRAHPPLLHRFWLSGDDTTFLIRIVRDAKDESLARSVGIPLEGAAPFAGLLSPREHEVQVLLAEGLTNKQIAQALFISESTVKVHIRHIFEKLGVKTRTEAATYRPDETMQPVLEQDSDD